MEALVHLDGSILLWIQEYIRHDFMNDFWIFVTHLGDKGLMWIILSALLLIFPQTRKAGILALASMALCALVTNLALKPLVARPRPYTQISDLILMIQPQPDFSFPSGHTTASVAAACSYLRGFAKKRYAIPFVILAALIAFSRLYVGVHYPTDVLGGLIIGLVGSWIVAVVYRRIKKS